MFYQVQRNIAVCLEILEHFMVPCAGKFYGDADFLFQQVLAPALSAKTKLFVDRVWLIGWPTRLN